MNRPQKTILAIGGLIVAILLLSPPWQQPARLELDYRQSIGRGFILLPPKPVAVDCYFAGCGAAPPSYFHVVLYSELHIAQCATAICIVVALVWMFGARRGGAQPTLRSWRTRLIFSMLIALAVTPAGDFPLASLLADIPRQFMHRDELWLIPVLFLPLLYVFFSGIAYGIVTLAVWITARVFRRTVAVRG